MMDVTKSTGIFNHQAFLQNNLYATSKTNIDETMTVF